MKARMQRCSDDGKLYVWEGERGSRDYVGRFRYPRWPWDVFLWLRFHMLPDSPTHRNFTTPTGRVIP